MSRYPSDKRIRREADLLEKMLQRQRAVDDKTLDVVMELDRLRMSIFSNNANRQEIEQQQKTEDSAQGLRAK